MSSHGLAVSTEQFWALTPREFYALRDVWEMSWDRQMSLYAGLQATLHNAWLRGEHRAPFRPEDFYTSKHAPKVDRRKLADPLDPNGTQTVQEKMYWMRTMLQDAASRLTPDKMVEVELGKEYDTSAIESAWMDFQNVTGQKKPN